MKQGDSDSDSDGSAGHVWAAVIDARGTVISKAFQGRHDSASYLSVCACCVFFLCACVGVNVFCLSPQRAKPA